MDPARYEVVPIGIARDGRWYLYHDALRMLRAAVMNLGELSPADVAVSLLPQPGDTALVSLPGDFRPRSQRRTALDGPFSPARNPARRR